MSKISLVPNASGTGTLSIASPSTNSDYTLTLPAETGTVLTSGGAIDVNASAPADSLAISSAGNVGIGTSSPAARLNVVENNASTTTTSGGTVTVYNSNASGRSKILIQNYAQTASGSIYYDTGVGGLTLQGDTGAILQFNTNGANERMRIASAGEVLMGKTTVDDSTVGFAYRTAGYISVVRNGGAPCFFNRTGTDGAVVEIGNDGSTVGTISVSGSTTAYNTSSDYRLKENIAPMTGALATVAQLNPVTYTWKVDGSTGQGFIAHELQAVIPDAVSGEKDAVETYTDEEGNEQTRPVYQGVDTSFLVATLTAAIQELKSELDAAKERISALEAGNVPT